MLGYVRYRAPFLPLAEARRLLVRYVEHLLLTNVLNARYTFLAYSVVLVLVSVAVD